MMMRIWIMNKPVKMGRKEILTEDLARRICAMIENFPDAGISVTWENVIAQSKKKFGHGFNRQMLGQKEWEGRKLIGEAFNDAKELQRRMVKDATPKYATNSRATMQQRIAELESQVLALKEELEAERARKISELDTFLNSRIDLRELFSAAKGNQ